MYDFDTNNFNFAKYFSKRMEGHGYALEERVYELPQPNPQIKQMNVTSHKTFSPRGTLEIVCTTIHTGDGADETYLLTLTKNACSERKQFRTLISKNGVYRLLEDGFAVDVNAGDSPALREALEVVSKGNEAEALAAEAAGLCAAQVDHYRLEASRLLSDSN